MGKRDNFKVSMEKTDRAQSERVRGMSEKPTMAARRIVLPTGSWDSAYDMQG